MGLLATPYTLLANPIHPRVKTDKVKVLDKQQKLGEKIKKSIKRQKIYHPIREKFMRDETRRVAFLLEEFLKNEEETERGAIVIRIPKGVFDRVEKPQRLAAESGLADLLRVEE